MAKIGVEWVRKYHGRASNLSSTQKQAEGFYNTLSGTRSFNWGDDLAWDQDFEERGKGNPQVGTDTSWVDAVDIVYFSGHGNQDGALFGVANHDDGKAKSSEVAWGNGSLKWIVFDACKVLRESGIWNRWGWPVFRGVHYILGFHSTCSDESKRGRYFAEYLNSGYDVRQAWIKACKETEDSSGVWAYLRADQIGTSTYNDHWCGKGHVSPDPSDPATLYYLKGSC